MSFAGEYVNPRTNLLEWQHAWLSSTLVLPYNYKTIAETFADCVAVLGEALKARPLFECCQDLVDAALASKNRNIILATLDYVCLRQHFYGMLFDKRVSPLVELQRQLNFGWYWQLRLQSALDGNSLWLH